MQEIAYKEVDQVIGNATTANLFLCLLRPAINMTNNDQNVLAQEVERFLKGKHSPAKIDLVINRLSRIVIHRFAKENININAFTCKDKNSRYWRALGKDLFFDENFRRQLHQGLTELSSESFRGSLESEINKWIIKRRHLAIDNKGNIEQPAINYFDYKMVEKFNRLLAQELSPVEQMHYFVNYYWPLVSDKSSGRYFKQLYQTDSGLSREEYISQTVERFAQLKICNLAMLSTGGKVGRLIIDRIDDEFADDSNLRFVFQNYPQWRKVLIKALADKRGLVVSDVRADFENDYEQYFYQFTTKQTLLTPDNFARVRVLNGDYRALKNSITK